MEENKDFIFSFNEDDEIKEYKEPFCSIDCETENDYNDLIKKINDFDKLKTELEELKNEIKIYKIALEIASVDLDDEFYYTRKEIEERRKDRAKQYLEMAKDDKNSKK